MKKKTKTQRTIRLSVMLPCTVTIVVETDEKPTAEADWTITRVINAHCDQAAVRTINENMCDADHDELVRKAIAAKDDE